MKQFRTDLHIHTVLSPCASLEMSPDIIIEKAKAMNLDIIGITDHNSTRQCALVKMLGEKCGIAVLTGAEVTTREEVHCLVFFETESQLNDFQRYLDMHLPDLKNDPARFGYQVVVDADNMIVFEEERLLISAIDQSIGQLAQKVHELNGLFIPAHIDRLRFGLLGQLGFAPSDLNDDGLEISTNCIPEAFISQHPELSGHQIISGSDAHHPDQIGRRVTVFEMDNADFECFRLAIRSKHPGIVKILI